MFQRLRGAIDARIAEEQARQKAAQEALSRSSSTRRNVTGTPTRTGSRARRESSHNNSTSTSVSATTTPPRGPDPTEFEPEFVIDDDDDGVSSSGVSTPRVEKARSNAGETTTSSDVDQRSDGGPGDTIANGQSTSVTGGDSTSSQMGTESVGDKKVSTATTAPKADTEAKTAPSTISELPADVRVRLRRLDKLELKYQGIFHFIEDNSDVRFKGVSFPKKKKAGINIFLSNGILHSQNFYVHIELRMRECFQSNHSKQPFAKIHL
jgi:hypothetical protein